jgi:acetyl-CoA carboxylase biotin carboxyl carrier protein
MIDLRYIKKLIDMLDGSTVDSIEISSDKGMKLRIAKSPAQRGTVQVAAPLPVPALIPPIAAVAPAAPAAGPQAAAAPAAPAAPALLEVKSPMVGTFFAAPEPGAKPYVSEGSRVQKGQILCIIEAMKIMNEIESEYDGVIRNVLVQDSHPVEYGQALFRVDPNG